MWLAVAISPLAALWWIWQNARINQDGVWYIAVAKLIADGDWSAAVSMLNAPLYPAILAALHNTLGIDFETAAYLWTLAVFALVTFALLAFIRELGGGTIALVYGFVLLALHPEMRDMLANVMRDQGYWAFYLLSVWCFIRYWRTTHWRDAVGWWLCMVVAALFRIEGIVILSALPLALLARMQSAWTARIGMIVRLHLPSIAIVVLGGVVLWLIDGNPVERSRLPEVSERLSQLRTLFSEMIPQRAAVVENSLLSPFATGQSTGSVWAIIAFITVSSTMRAVQWVYLAVAAAAFIPRSSVARDHLVILVWLALLQAVVMTVFVAFEMYLSSRSAVGLALIVLPLTAMGLEGLHFHFLAHLRGQLWRLWPYPVALLLLAMVCLRDIAWSGPPPSIAREAGQWVKQNVPDDSSVYFAQSRTRYYADRPFKRRSDESWDGVAGKLEDGTWRTYDYLVLEIDEQHPQRLDIASSLLACDPVASFQHDGMRIVVFDIAQCPGEAQ